MKWYPSNYSGGGGTENKTVTFNPAEKRENIKSGEKHKTIFGKIARYFADLKTVAFTGNYSDLSGRPSSMPASDVPAWAKAANKPSYNWSEIGSKPSAFTPAAHKHGKADITDFPSSMPASDVKAWAKAANKPSYTAAEVGALPAGSDLNLKGSVFLGDGAFRLFKGYYTEGYHVANFNDVLHNSGVGFTSKGPDYCSLHPHKDGGGDLGWGFRWNDIFTVNSGISTSDREQKKENSYIGTPTSYDTSMSDEMLINLIMGIKPAVFKRKNGESGRPHHGFIAQDVEELIQKLGIKDHAGFIKSPKTRTVKYTEEQEVEKEITDEETGESKKITVTEPVEMEKQEEVPGEYIYGLRYEEFISDIIRFCQILYNRNTELETALEEQKEKTENLVKRIETLENIINQRA